MAKRLNYAEIPMFSLSNNTIVTDLDIGVNGGAFSPKDGEYLFT